MFSTFHKTLQPDFTLLGKLRSTWASSAVNVIHPISLCLSWFLGTIGCSSPLPLRCADLRILLLKCQGILPPPTVLPFRHLPASLLSNHSTFGFLFLCPSSCLSGRCIGIPEEVCRLDPSCFPTRCLLGKFLLYYASSPTPLAPPTSSISYLPVFDLPQPEKTSTESVCQSPANDATVVPPPSFCPSR